MLRWRRCSNPTRLFSPGASVGQLYEDGRKWPGLGRKQLYRGRDLEVTTDYRRVLGELLLRHLGAPNIEPVFPRLAYRPGLDLIRTS